MSIAWINSAGGPLICSVAHTRSAWRGVGGSSMGLVRTDYERSCDIHDYQGVIPCGGAMVLVLGDEPLQSAFIKAGGDISIVRWIACSSTARAEEVLGALPLQLRTIGDAVEFLVSDSNLFMFDAALDGWSTGVANARCVDLAPGRYEVTIESYKLEKEFEFLIHRFKLKELKDSVSILLSA